MENTDTPEVVATPEAQPLNATPWYDGVAGVTDKDMEYGSVEDYVKGTQSLRSLISKKGIIPPDEHADDATRSQFADDVKQYLPQDMLRGAVPDAEAYDIEALKTNEALDDARRLGIQDSFNKAGLTNAQAEAMIDMFGEQSSIDMQKLQDFNAQTVKDTETQLRAELGADYEDRASAVDNVLKRHPQVAEKLAQVGLQGDMEIFRMLDAVARATSEDSVESQGGGKQSAQSEYAEFIASAEYKDVMFPGLDSHGRVRSSTPEQREAMGARARSILARSMS